MMIRVITLGVGFLEAVVACTRFFNYGNPEMDIRSGYSVYPQVTSGRQPKSSWKACRA